MLAELVINEETISPLTSSNVFSVNSIRSNRVVFNFFSNLAVFLTSLTMVWGFVTCGPNEALIISGNVLKFVSFKWLQAFVRSFVAYIFNSIILSILSISFTGCCYSTPLLVPGGRAFVWPTIQSVQR